MYPIQMFWDKRLKSVNKRVRNLNVFLMYISYIVSLCTCMDHKRQK